MVQLDFSNAMRRNGGTGSCLVSAILPTDFIIIDMGLSYTDEVKGKSASIEISYPVDNWESVDESTLPVIAQSTFIVELGGHAQTSFSAEIDSVLHISDFKSTVINTIPLHFKPPSL